MTDDPPADDARLDDELRERITVASAGNPLYLEEMLAMVREHGAARSPPPTIHALLQAAWTLEGDVRVVMECGAMKGGFMLSLPRGEAHSHPCKELISPDFPEDEGFRFATSHAMRLRILPKPRPSSTSASRLFRRMTW